MHWFLITNQEEVRIFSRLSGESHLSLLRTIVNPLGKARRRELIRKEAGEGIRSIGRVGAVRYTEGRPRDPKEEAALQFAREVGHILELERQRGAYVSLTVAAEPHFLGKLKAEFGPAVQEKVTSWIPKDLQKTPLRNLEEILLHPDKRTGSADDHSSLSGKLT